MGIAYLSSAHGQEIQQRAYNEIMKVYPDGDAWERCLLEEKVPYITALVKEVLRFWTVIPICLPRVSIKDIPWKNAVIPAGSTFFMVSTYIYISFPSKNTNNPRMPTQPITTKHTSNLPSHLTQTATSMSLTALERLITPTVPEAVCALARTSLIENCTLRSCDLSAHLRSCPQRTARMIRSLIRWSVI